MAHVHTLSVADTAAIAGVLAMASVAMGDTEPVNETFPGELLTGSVFGVSILGNLEDRDCGGGFGYASVGLPPPEAGECPMPDTLMRAWVQFGLTEVDDNSSPLGDGFASAIYGATPYYDYDYGYRAVLEITGTQNMYWNHGFPHGEIGRFEGFLTWRDAGGASLGTETFDETFRLGNEIFGFEIFGVPAGTETYDVELDNDACITSSCNRPDTFLGLFDAGGNLIDTDDDSSFAGNGTASLISAPLDGETLLEWRVTGTGNTDFTPDFLHGQLGQWEMIVDFFGPSGWLGGTYVDDMPFVAGDEVFSGFFDVPTGADFVELWIDNTIQFCPCDIDFYTIEGLLADTEYEVSIAENNTWLLVAWMDQAGYPNDTTDWEPMLVTTDGEGFLYLAVTGGSDYDLLGGHEESGDYEVGVALGGPPPCNAADLAEPYGLLDLSDINAFAAAFLANDPLADLEPDGLFDLSDITTFINAFVQGCFR